MKYLYTIIFLFSLIIGQTVLADYTDDDDWSNENFDSLTVVTDNDHYWTASVNAQISTAQSYSGTKSLMLKSPNATPALTYLNGYTNPSVEMHEMKQYNTFRFYIEDLALDNNKMGEVRYMTCDGTSCSYAGSFGFWATSSEVLITFGTTSGAQITDYEIGRVDEDTWNLLYIDFNNISRQFTIKLNSVTIGTYNLQISSKPLLRQIRFSGLASATQGKMYIDDISFYEADPYITWSASWFDLSETYPDVSVPINTICFINEYCPIEFRFNDLAIGSDLYIITDLDNPYVGYEATSTTITYNYEYTDYVYVPSVATATVTPYYLLIDSPIGDIRQGGNKITWVDKNEYLPDFSFLDDPCSEIATSSGDFWDDFRYGFECGGAKLIAWAFNPSDDKMNAIQDEFEGMQQNFPVNILTNTRKTLENSQTSTTSLKLFPFLNASATPFGYLIDQEQIEASDNFGIVNYIRTYLSSIIYGGFFVYIVLRIFNLKKREE